MAVDAIRDNTARPLFKIIDQLPAEENDRLVDLINTVRLPYSSAQFLMSVEEINIETMREQQAEVGMLAYLMLANMGGTAVDRWQYGPSSSPKDQFNPNSRLDSIEWKGWSVKGPQSFMKSPEVVGNPGGQAAGTKEKIISTGDIDYRQSSLDKAFSKHSSDFGTYPDGSNTSIELFKSDINELLETGMQKSGTYRATPGTHVFNSSTHQWAFYDSNGNFITAFKLSPDQFKYLTETGVVK